jgi:vacuolar-type H+-ATPase subunit E/Vma4
VIEHCAENAPELKNDLLNERPAFIEKLTEAGRPLLEKLKGDPEFNAPVQASMREDMDKINSYGLSIFKQQDAGVVCRRALEKMQNATVDELRKGVEDTYQKYREAGQKTKSG